MNKIKILLFLIIALKLSNSFAQGGIDLSVSPFNRYRVFKSQEENAFMGGQYTGFKIGYFKWMNESAMLKLSLEVNSIKNDNFTTSLDYSTFPPKTEVTKYSYEASSYIIRYEGIGVQNEIDFKSHFFFKSAYMLGIRNAKFSMTGIEKVEMGSKSSDLESLSFSDIEKLNGTSVLFGIEYGLGYQYNITKFMGIYADADIGYILPTMIYFNTNIGIRYRLN